MGGVIVLLSGDFRQILPVVRKGTPADELRACLKASVLWRHVKTIRLTENMRVRLQGDSNEFAKLLLKIGDGKVPIHANTDEIKIPAGCGEIVHNSQQLMENVYGEIAEDRRFNDHDWLCERAILAPKNGPVLRFLFYKNL